MSAKRAHELDPLDRRMSDETSDFGGGTSQDAKDMTRLGNKQELKRNFRSLPVLGLSCVLITTWTAVLTGGSIALVNGGRGGFVWTYLVIWFLNLFVVASMAEMASIAPTAGGQYHWVSEFAPRRLQKPASYVSGWLSALGWQTLLAGSAYYAAAQLLTMVSIGNPSYTPTKWQQTLLTIAVGLVSVVFNIFGARHLPMFENIILVLYVLGFFGIAIPLWVIAPKVSARDVFLSFENLGGWASIGAACVIGQTSTSTAFTGVDSAVHMAEEVKNASRNVPRMMVLTILVNGLLGFAMLLTYVFVIQDIEKQVLGATSPFPLFDVFLDAIGSPGGVIGMTVPLLIMSICAAINSVMAASRQAWSFARDNGLPFPGWLNKVVTIDSTPVPINAMIVSLSILVVIALLNLGGSEIVASLVGLAGAAIESTYFLSISCIFWRRLFGDPLPPAYFSLGRFGAVVNAVSMAYLFFSIIISFFPLFRVVDAESMNWSSTVFGGVAILCILSYMVVGRKRYEGPVVRVHAHET